MCKTDYKGSVRHQFPLAEKDNDATNSQRLPPTLGPLCASRERSHHANWPALRTGTSLSAWPPFPFLSPFFPWALFGRVPCSWWFSFPSLVPERKNRVHIHGVPTFCSSSGHIERERNKLGCTEDATFLYNSSTGEPFFTKTASYARPYASRWALLLSGLRQPTWLS